MDAIVASSVEPLLSVYDLVPDRLDAKVWCLLVTTIFEALSQRGVNQVDIAALLDSANQKTAPVTIQQLKSVINALAERNLLRVIASEAVAFHAPRLTAAFAMVKEKPVVQAYLK